MDFSTIFFVLSVICCVAVHGEESKAIDNRRLAVPGEYSFKVSLELNGKYFCSGALIDKRHVVTVANCIQPRENRIHDISVRIGSLQPEKGGELRKINNSKIHENYNRNISIYENNIALLTLDEDVQQSSTVKFIELVTSYVQGNEEISTGPYEKKQKDQLPLNLFIYSGNTLNNTYCGDFFVRPIITDNQLCATHKILCNDDVGNPLIYQGKLVGLGSYLYPQCLNKHIIRYTRISEYISWIQQAQQVV